MENNQMNYYKDSTILRFIYHFDTIEPAISKGSVILSHGILQKIEGSITKSFYDENQTEVDKFMVRIEARLKELNIKLDHEAYKTIDKIKAIITPQQMVIENGEKLNLKPIRIERTPYFEYAEKRKKMMMENKMSN